MQKSITTKSDSHKKESIIVKCLKSSPTKVLATKLPTTIEQQKLPQSIAINFSSPNKLKTESLADHSVATRSPTSSTDSLHEERSVSNGREARNRAEKNRRDKLNGSIHELTTMVPHVADSPRRVDKTAILRFAAHGLRIDYVFGKQILKFSDETNGLMDIFLKLLDSFLITVTCKGQIILVSSSIEQHLGHCQTDLYGQDLLQFTHPDDQLKLKQQLIPNDLERLFDIQPDDDAGEPRKRSQDEEDEIDRRLCEDRRRFTIRLARAAPRSEPKTYENVRIDGCFRRADFAPRGIKSSTFPAGLHLIRRSRGRDDSLPLQTISGNDIVLVAMAHVIKPPTICDRVLEACKCEYKTRHLTDGRIVQCDQRISIVAGYMPDEVSGLSPFTFMHKDDVRWVMVALRQMYDYSSPIGESCYRLITRTGQFVYLRTRGFLEIDKESNEVRSFICYNTLMSEEDGRKLVHEMKKKYAILIHNHNFSSTDTDVPAVEHPVKIHRAVLNLITNLHRGHNDPVSVGASPRSTDNPPPSIEEIDPDVVRNITSPPLSIIAPLPDTIEPSISKSVNVIVTSKKGQSVDAPDDSDYLPEPESCNQTRSTVLHRAIKSEPSTSCSPSNRPTTSKIISLDSDGGAYIKQEPCDLTFDSTDAIPTCLPPFNEESFDGFDLSGDMSTTMTDLQLLTTLESEPPSPEDSGKRQLKRSCRYVDTNTTKRRSNLTIDETDLKTALPASFNELDCSLQDVHDETSVMSKRLRVCYPEANRKLDEIIVERERQLNLLNAIRGEYQSCIQDGASALSDSLKIRKTAK